MNWFPKKNIVVPIDFSDESFAALDTAMGVVEDVSGLCVVNVLGETPVAEPGQIWHTIDDNSRRENVTKALRERLSGTAYEDIRIEVRFGDPGHEIADLAQEMNADLIVIPSRGRTGLTRLLIGSTAERVVRLAHCPVLVLRQ